VMPAWYSISFRPLSTVFERGCRSTPFIVNRFSFRRCSARI
jgi:hypothetical protein